MMATETSTTETSTTTTTNRRHSRALRLAACDLVRRRFSGRAEMRRKAKRSDLHLALLESLLLLRPETPEQIYAEDDLRAAFRRAAEWEAAARRQMPGANAMCMWEAAGRRPSSPSSVGAVLGLWARGGYGAPASFAARLSEVRAARRESRRGIPTHERAIDRHARVVAGRAYDAAGLRTASHAHSVRIRIAVGRPTASSETGSVSSESAGMSRAYCRQQWTVTSSSHTLWVTAAIMTPEVMAANRAAPSGVLYLDLTTRVRNGRGSSLVVERLEPGSTGRLAWRRS